MFEQNSIIKSPKLAEAWLRAVVAVEGTGWHMSYPEDCAEIVEHFRRVGVTISADEANSFWNAYSESVQAGWVGLSVDCVAALDALAEEIEEGSCFVERLQALRGTVKVTA